MWLKIMFLIAFTISATLTEQPINKSGPYAASGWRPRKPFNLPSGGGFPPATAEPAKQRQVVNGFEITKARVDYVGQVRDNVFIPNNRQPHKEYLPPNNENPDFLSIQDLPLEVIFEQYRPLKQQQESEQPINQQQQQQPQDGTNIHKPAHKYGPPQPRDFNIIYPDPAPRNSDESLNGSDVNDYAPDLNDQRNEYVRAKQGQYFVLGPDNILQRVVFTTTQSEEEQRTNGFTAQLKYTPVGELRDPVFKYNNSGQLVRVLKK